MKMKVESKPLRYAHAEGHTDVCFSEDGQHIITCGHDGDVRIWVDIEDDDPNSHCVGESALAVCFKDKRLYVATDSNVVQAYTFPAFDKDGIVTRFTAPITHIMSSSKIEALGCSSENMEARICSPEGGAPLFVMSEHKGPVLSIALCPHMKYASTACGDGLLRIWDIDTQKIVKEMNCVPKINTFYAAKVLCRMDFEPSEGKYLAYPNNREIILVDCDTWSQRMSFTHGSIKCPISQCKFSPCGKYLAGSTVAGQIAVWEVESGACVDIVDHPTSHNVTALAWNPKGNGVLAYCDAAGQLGALRGCCGRADPPEEADDDIVDNLIENYESDDDNAISLEKLKNETLRGVDLDEDSRPASRLSPVVSANAPPQPPFQPSSTPVHLEHRYMCWNDVGIVRCHTAADGSSTIDVEFHDTSVHHALHLNNYLRHTMASLADSVLALACEPPSKLVCISLVGSSKEWTVSLPGVEEVVCVSAARHVVGAATSARLLRLFTPCGTQRQVISLAGPAVALAGYNTTIMAAYHRSEPGPHDQHLAMDIIAMNGSKVRCKTVPLPLSPGSKLSWLGASNAGSPAAADGAGALRLYDVASGVWLPVCDASEHARGASDNWFIVSICEASQKVRAILCRGASCPPAAPTPIVTELPLQIPLCSPETEQAQCEERLLRWAHTAAGPDVRQARETALKLFALACRSEIEQRALELMELLRDERLLPLAAKYASRLGRVHLAEKIAELSTTWSEEDGNNEQERGHYQQLEQDTCDVTDTESLNTSLIIPQRAKEKKAEVIPIKPVPIKSSPGGARNPFKKSSPASAAPGPLRLAARPLVKHDRTENADPLQPIANESFVDWFTRNKTVLEQQNPELTPSELTRQCVRQFKGLQKIDTDSSKRKLDDSDIEPTVANAPKQSKLSAFAFKKNVDISQ